MASTYLDWNKFFQTKCSRNQRDKTKNPSIENPRGLFFSTKRVRSIGTGLRLDSQIKKWKKESRKQQQKRKTKRQARTSQQTKLLLAHDRVKQFIKMLEKVLQPIFQVISQPCFLFFHRYKYRCFLNSPSLIQYFSTYKAVLDWFSMVIYRFWRPVFIKLSIITIHKLGGRTWVWQKCVQYLEQVSRDWS